MSPAGPPNTKLSSLLSRHWLRPRAEVQGLLWLWVPGGTHNQTSWSVERWPCCSITQSGKVTFPKCVVGPSRLVLPDRLDVATAGGGRHFHDPVGADPGLTDVLLRLLGPQRPGDVAAVADLVICCYEGDPAPCQELAVDLAVQRIGWDSG